MKIIITAQSKTDAGVVYPSPIAQDIDNAMASLLISAGKAYAVNSAEYDITLQAPKKVIPVERQKSNIAVCVTCHGEYLQYLRNMINSVDNQTITAKDKYLVLDNCDKPNYIPDDWIILRTTAGSPNPGRNKALELTDSPWIVFADGDDTMHADFLAAYFELQKQPCANIAAFYPDLDCSNGRKMITPEYDFWNLRLHDHISMASCWRVSALKSIGGLDNFVRYDDWTMALRLTRLGWRLKKQDKIPVLYHIHGGGHRSFSTDNGFECHWYAHTYGIVSLLSGRENCLPDWQNWIKKADLPPETTLYVLDNSGKPAFSKKVKKFLSEQTKVKTFYMAFGKPVELETWFSRHEWVPHLYNKILPHVEDDYVVMFEDDVVPPLDGLKTIMQSWEMRGHDVGGISGCYPSRQRPAEYVGTTSLTERHWGAMYFVKDITENKLYRAGKIAGGFSVYQNALIKQAMPFRFIPHNYSTGEYCAGWDSNLSLFLRDSGYKVFLHGGVICQHNFEDTQLQQNKVKNEN